MFNVCFFKNFLPLYNLNGCSLSGGSLSGGGTKNKIYLFWAHDINHIQ